jgi:uncharacterized protein YkwD
MRPGHFALAVGFTVALATSAAVAAANGVSAPAKVATTASRVESTPFERDPLRRAVDEVGELVNQFRVERGLAPLQWNDSLMLAAQRYAEELAQRRTLSHTGVDGSTASERAAAAGFQGAVAENLASGFQDPVAVVEAWIASPGHLRNLLIDFEYLGIGVAVDGGTPYWVLLIATDDWVAQ